MTTSTKLGATTLQPGVEATQFQNDWNLKLENALLSKVLSATIAGTNAPPGSPVFGDTYIVGASPSGAWLTPVNLTTKVVVWNGVAWVAVSRDASMIAYVNGEKVRYAYDSNESLWYPMQDQWSTTESWTGRYRDTLKLYQKVIDFGALPNAALKSVAHGISPFPLTYKRAAMIDGVIANGTTVHPLWTRALTITTVTVDATNINITTTGNDSAFSAYIRMEYTKS